MNLPKYNLHWQEGYSYEYNIKRDSFARLVMLADKKQIVALTGMRRTGKTVLMKQLINYFIDSKKIKRKNIVYFSFDEDKVRIEELLNEYANITGVDMHKEKIFVFLDEVQKIENWQEQIKVYYDNYSNIKIFVSGSASLFIRKKATESLAGRIYVLDLPILNFREFLMFRNKENLLKNPKMFLDALKRELNVYLRRNFIDIIDEDEETAIFYMESIINKVVYEDIPLLFPVENPDKLKAIVKAIYSNPGMIIKYDSLGSDIGLSAKTIEKYIFYLLQSKIIKKVYNFSRNYLTSEKKLKKFYMSAPCFCFLADNYDITKIVENMVALNAEFFWRDATNNEVDFIFKKDSKLWPVEVKYRRNIKKEDSITLKKFMSKFDVKKGTVITQDYEQKGAIDFIPFLNYILQQQ